MRYGLILLNEMVPQWRQCYMQYQILKLFVILIKEVVDLIKKLEKHQKKSGLKKKKEKSKHNHRQIESQKILPQQTQKKHIKNQRNTQGHEQRHIDAFEESHHNLDSETIINQPNLKEQQAQRTQLKEELHFLLKSFNLNFYRYLKFYLDLCQLFMQMKHIQLYEKFKYYQDFCKKYHFLKDPGVFYSQSYCAILQYIYIQNAYLKKMFELVKQGQRKILKKHIKVSKGFATTPGKFYPKLQRLLQSTKNLDTEIQDYYIHFTNQSSKQSRIQLRTTSDKKQVKHIDSFFFGLGVGAGLAILAFLIAILTQNNFVIDSENTPQGKAFNWDFAVWRGIAFFIFYYWILSFNIWAYQTYNINHRLIFKFNQHHYSTSRDMFKVAGAFSTIFMVLFLIYIIQFTKIVEWGYVFPEYYLMLAVWGVFLIYLFVPLPIFNYKGRIYAAKVLFWSAAAPLTGVIYPVIWGTDQLVSLANPFSDLVYSICYYSNLQSIKFIQPPESRYNPCVDQSRSIVTLIVGCVAYSFRIMQCLKQGYDAPRYINTPPFWNTIKYLLSLLTVILSFLYKLQNDLIALWIIFAAISTIYSYVWDLKIDWGLFQNDHPYFKFLRKDLFFPVQLYYFMIVNNFVLRLVWVLSISPDIAKTFGSPQVWALVTGMLEIVRRGFWNLLRTECEQIKNCGKFQALPDVQQVQQKLVKQCQQFMQSPKYKHNEELIPAGEVKQNRVSPAQILKIRQEFLELIQAKIDQKMSKHVKANDFYQTKMKQIQHLGLRIDNLQKGIFKKVVTND